MSARTARLASTAILLSALLVIYPASAKAAARTTPRVVKPLEEVEVLLHKGAWGGKGGKVSIGGVIYDDVFTAFDWAGLGSQYSYSATFDIGRRFDYLEAWIGVNDESRGDCSATFSVEGDGVQIFSSESIAKGDKAAFICVPVRGVRSLQIAGRGTNNPVSVWAEPRLIKGSPSKPPAGTPLPPPGEVARAATPDDLAPFAVDPRDLDKLAAELRQKVDANPSLKSRLDTGRVAISTFELVDIPSPSVARNVAEDLYTALINTGFALVERGQLDKVLKELKIQSLGLADPKTMQKLGQLSGCDVVLLGSISDRGNFVVINARLMETATGKSLVADRVEMRKMPITRGGM